MSKEIDWSKAPEGATHAAFTKGGNNHHVWYLIQGDGYHYCYSDCISLGWLKGADSKPSHSPLIERPQIAWTGTGLPPVGTVCELNGHVHHELRKQPFEWVECTVIAHTDFGGKPIAVAKTVDGSIGWGMPIKFRPIRAPEQIAAEEREKAVSDMLSMWMDCGSARDFCEYLHDHGYRKIEDVK